MGASLLKVPLVGQGNPVCNLPGFGLDLGSLSLFKPDSPDNYDLQPYWILENPISGLTGPKQRLPFSLQKESWLPFAKASANTLPMLAPFMGPGITNTTSLTVACCVLNLNKQHVKLILYTQPFKAGPRHRQNQRGRGGWRGLDCGGREGQNALLVDVKQSQEPCGLLVWLLNAVSTQS